MGNYIFLPGEVNKKRPVIILIYVIFGSLLGLINILEYPLFISPSFKLIASNPAKYLTYLVDFLLACLLLLSSIGVWYGKVWGWNLSIFYLFSCIVGSILFISEIFFQIIPVPANKIFWPTNLALNVISLTAYLIFVGLFLKKPIIDFFAIDHQTKLGYLIRIAILSIIFGPLLWYFSR